MRSAAGGRGLRNFGPAHRAEKAAAEKLKDSRTGGARGRENLQPAGILDIQKSWLSSRRMTA
eukprot:scaffold576_cov260-Pinguiococcus_pyrenoidosus.AAC.60